MEIAEIDEVSSKFRDLPKCPRCNGPMITHPAYQNPFCGSWAYMEGGCPPAPIPIRRK